jgi:hypothetical protein
MHDFMGRDGNNKMNSTHAELDGRGSRKAELKQNQVGMMGHGWGQKAWKDPVLIGWL